MQQQQPPPRMPGSPSSLFSSKSEASSAVPLYHATDGVQLDDYYGSDDDDEDVRERASHQTQTLVQQEPALAQLVTSQDVKLFLRRGISPTSSWSSATAKRHLEAAAAKPAETPEAVLETAPLPAAVTNTPTPSPEQLELLLMDQLDDDDDEEQTSRSYGRRASRDLRSPPSALPLGMKASKLHREPDSVDWVGLSLSCRRTVKKEAYFVSGITHWQTR